MSEASGNVENRENSSLDLKEKRIYRSCRSQPSNYTAYHLLPPIRLHCVDITTLRMDNTILLVLRSNTALLVLQFSLFVLLPPNISEAV